MINGSMSRQRLVKNYVPQGSVLGWALFNILINDTESEIQCTLCKSATDIKLSSSLDTTEGWDVIQGDLNKMEKWAHKNFMKFNKFKCIVLHLGQEYPRCEYRLGEELTEIISAEDLEVLVDEKLDIKQQHALTAKKGNRILNCIKRGVASRSKEEILSFYCAPWSPHWSNVSSP